MKRCTDCNGPLQEKKTFTPDGIEYKYFRCNNCGEEVLDREQLHNITNKYRIMKKYRAKLSKWGLSLGVRIPRELEKKYKLKRDHEITMIPEKEGIRIIP